VERFLERLQSLGGVQCEIVPPGDYHLETCRGCKLCLDRGEELCPLKDDRDLLLKKLEESDGVVLASPNYAFQVSGLTKTFLDRLAFLFHRPRFFGKVSTGLVVQGIYGGGKILDYLDFVGGGLGFNTLKGSCLTALEPLTAKARQQADRTLAAHARRFHRRLGGAALPAPGLLQLMIFRMSRTGIRLMLDSGYRDHGYYAEQGWFESGYYYPARLGAAKRAAGRLFDALAAARARKAGRGAGGPGEGERTAGAA
jgi:multimeric flavodoxin WrbA